MLRKGETVSGKSAETKQTGICHTLGISGIDTDKVREMLEGLTARYDDEIKVQEETGDTLVTVKACESGKEQKTAQLIAEIRSIIGEEYVYGVDIGGIEYALVARLREKGLKIATAESLTGGMVSESITRVPGASEVLECGVCSYSNRIKHEILGVSEEMLEKYTEYSAQTACEMAQGVRRLSGADIGAATTGIAGPGGGSAERPVGLVYVGISTKDRTFAKKLLLSRGQPDEREKIRILACKNALYLAWRELG